MRVLESLRSAAYILGTAIVAFVATRNTFTWHVQNFWGASGDFWQGLFDKLYSHAGGTDFSIGFTWSAIYINLWFWGLCFLYAFFDFTGFPKFLRSYKMQYGKNEPPDRKAFILAIKRVLLNQLFVYIPFWYVFYHLYKWRGCPFSGPISTFQSIVFEMVIFILVEEFGFYHSHRLFHSPTLYKRFHKIHHEWTAPIAVTSIYAHPLEHLIANLLPGALGPLLCGSHIMTMWMWQALVVFSTINAHSGYHLPFFPSPEAHDYHHLKFNNCFGMLGILDRLHRTDESFRASPAYKRHMMMLTLTPPRELFPDKPPPGMHFGKDESSITQNFKKPKAK